MTVIDAQIHVFEANRPERPWTGTGSTLAEATGESVLALMDAAHVDAAIIVSPWLNYLADASYALSVAGRHPDRFRVVAPIDPDRTDPAVAAEWEADDRVVGARLMLWSPRERERLRAGQYDALLSAIEQSRLPLCVALGPEPQDAADIGRRFPGLSVVIDHLGLPSPSQPPVPDEPLARLPAILRLAELPNMSVKVTGMPALSHDDFPYRDLFGPLRSLIDAFGPRRAMWGTDWTRTHDFLDYSQGVRWIDQAGLDPDEVALLRGGAAAAVFTLIPTAAAPGA